MILQCLWCCNKAMELLFLLGTPKMVLRVYHHSHQFSESHEMETNLLGSPPKSQNVGCTFLFSFPSEGEAKTWVFSPNCTALCQGSRGTRPGKMQQPFLSTLIHSSSWLCVHLEFCDLFTGFRNSHKGNLVQILMSQYLLGRNGSLGFLSPPSC